MRYFKTLRDGYILTVGIGNIETEITQEEYNSLYEMFMSMPSENGYDFLLKADSLTWEKVEAQEEPEEDELTDEEALEIIFGGAT